MKISVNVKYMIVQGLYWMLFCVAMGFVSLYLLDQGCSNASIGATSAIFGLISAVLQPTLGKVCDRSVNVSWKKMAIICGICFLAVSILLFVFSGKLFSMAMIGMFIMIANLIMPFVNSALFYYENIGEHVNFGIARGIGSGMYAVMALIIGNLAAIYGVKVVPIFGILAAALFTLSIIVLPYDSNLDNSKTNEDLALNAKGSDTNNKSNFFTKYPAFIIMIVGFVLLQSTHTITCNYMLQIIQNLGGDSGNLGTTMAIQAVVEVPVLFCFAFLIKKISASKLMIIASIGYVVKAVLHFAAGSVSVIYIIQLAQMVSFAIFASASVYYTGDIIEEEDRTTGQSVMASCIVMGNVIGSFVGGVAIDKFGVKEMLIVNMAMAAVGCLIAMVAYWEGERAK